MSYRLDDDDEEEDIIGEQIEYHLNKCLEEKVEIVELFFEEVAGKFLDQIMRITDADDERDRRDIESKLSAYIQVYIPAMGGAMIRLKKEGRFLESEVEKLSNEVELKLSPYWLNEETRDLN